ncbi:zinc finger domain-containing protein [Streptomyces abyssalis]
MVSTPRLALRARSTPICVVVDVARRSLSGAVDALQAEIHGLAEAIDTLSGLVYALLPPSDRRPGVLAHTETRSAGAAPHGTPCPECHAGIGKPCRSLRGDPLDVSHGARRMGGASCRG